MSALVKPITPLDIALLQRRGFLIQFPPPEQSKFELKVSRYSARKIGKCVRCDQPAKYYEDKKCFGALCQDHAEMNAIANRRRRALEREEERKREEAAKNSS